MSHPYRTTPPIIGCTRCGKEVRLSATDVTEKGPVCPQCGLALEVERHEEESEKSTHASQLKELLKDRGGGGVID
jgi:hypothetical protein